MSIPLCAQNSIFIKTFTTHDSVMLRWVPANTDVWKIGNSNGYIIERFTTDEYLDLSGQDPIGKGMQLTSSPILPMAKNDTNWDHLVKDGGNAIVFQALYGTKSADLKKRAIEENLQFGLALKACDENISTAKLHGLYFADHSISPGESYVYLIHIAGKNTYSAIVSVDGNLSVVHAPSDPDAKFKNRSVMLSFAVTSSRSDAAGYIVERSDDSVHFTRVNSELLVFTRSQYENTKTELNYRDSFPQNGKTYWYRIKTFSCFEIESAPSKTVHGHGKEDWTIYPIIDTLFSADNKTATIRWRLNEISNVSPKNIILFRSSKVSGPYSILNNSVDIHAAEVKDDHPLFSNYYMLCAISSENDSGFSYPYLLQMKDDVPPAIPENISGTIDTNGVVHLKWKNVNDADLLGYRVFRSNTAGEEQIEITDSLLKKPEFTDSVTLNTLTRDVFYSVRSVDHMYNNSRRKSTRSTAKS
ncbi:MAG TPA: hypothetical protein VL651_00625, partial [Bacteroidia bacterium]|nr:hypothetical protein [Bacteroidia bacterium]